MMQDLRMRKLGTTEARIIRGKMSCQGAIIAIFAVLILPLHASAWNIPGHMLSGAMAYQVLRQDSPTTIPAVRSLLEKIPGIEPLEITTGCTSGNGTRRSALYARSLLGR
jgi:hypothetical protein